MGLLLSACVAVAAAAQANDSLAVARRIVAAASLAAKEYAAGVASRGVTVTAPAEVEEAKQFLEQARIDAPLLPASVRTVVEAELGALRAAVERVAPPDSVAALANALVGRIALATGGVLDPFPVRPPALARGAAVYQQQCLPCHGPTGRGDGPKAKRLKGPPPASLADRDGMRDVSPVDVYRKLTIGVAGTGMPEFEETLSSEDRWAVATYVATLRADDRMVREGEGLYAAQCAACHGAAGGGDGPLADSLSVRPPALRDLAVQGRFTDAELADLVLEGRAGTPMPGFGRGGALDRDRTGKLVAFLRLLPAAERQHYQPSLAAGTFSTVRRQLDSAVALRSDRLAFDAYLTFEQLETEVRLRNAALAGELEDAFAALRTRAAAGADDLGAIHARLLSGLERAERLVADKSSAANLFMSSFVVLLREGFEAILIVAALMTFLAKAGVVARRRHVARGAWAAVGASAVTAVLVEALFQITPGEREVLEGVTMLVATAVLFYVSYWLFSKVEAAKWNAFVKGRMEDALSAGSGFALSSVAFLAVYREGFETVLFYKALLTSAGSGGTAGVVGGVLVGGLALAIVYVGINRFGLRVPMKPFFAVTSAMLYYMAFVFAGKGVADLQEAGLLRTSVVEWAPRIPVLGIYPTVQSLSLQGLLILLLLVAAVWLQRNRLGAGQERRRPSYP